MHSTVNDLIAKLQALVAEDPSIGLLPFYTNSPMDGEYAFRGHAMGVYVGEVAEEVDEDSGQCYLGDKVPEEAGEVNRHTAVVIDSH